MSSRLQDKSYYNGKHRIADHSWLTYCSMQHHQKRQMSSIYKVRYPIEQVSGYGFQVYSLPHRNLNNKPLARQHLR